MPDMPVPEILATLMDQVSSWELTPGVVEGDPRDPALLQRAASVAASLFLDPPLAGEGPLFVFSVLAAYLELYASLSLIGVPEVTTLEMARRADALVAELTARMAGETFATGLFVYSGLLSACAVAVHEQRRPDRPADPV